VARVWFITGTSRRFGRVWAQAALEVLERRPDHVLVGSRAGGFHSRTIEVLDQRGVADRFLAEGRGGRPAESL
jgi:2-polyprenyl-6-methoxyphenol hydroxylase-like FAD-dependent oxidoreductase